MLEFIAVAQQIEQSVPQTLQKCMAAIFKVESNQIGVEAERLARQPWHHDEDARNAAYSCYYSGNLKRAFIPDSNGISYVQRVI